MEDIVLRISLEQTLSVNATQTCGQENDVKYVGFIAKKLPSPATAIIVDL